MQPLERALLRLQFLYDQLDSSLNTWAQAKKTQADGYRHLQEAMLNMNHVMRRHATLAQEMNTHSTTIGRLCQHLLDGKKPV